GPQRRAGEIATVDARGRQVRGSQERPQDEPAKGEREREENGNRDGSEKISDELPAAACHVQREVHAVERHGRQEETECEERRGRRDCRVQSLQEPPSLT